MDLFLAGKPERKRLFWRPTYVWQDNRIINLKEIRSNGFDWTSLQLHQLYTLFYLLHTYIMFLLHVLVISPHCQGELTCFLLKNTAFYTAIVSGTVVSIRFIWQGKGKRQALMNTVKKYVFRRPTRCSSKQSLFVLLPSHSTFYVWVSLHRKLIYIKNQRDATWQHVY